MEIVKLRGRRRDSGTAAAVAGRSPVNESSASCVLAAYASSTRCENSSSVSRPSAVASRSCATVCSRSASDARTTGWLIGSSLCGLLSPRQTAKLGGKLLHARRPRATRPQAEPVLLVEEELPVADHAGPHEQKRHRRLERFEARVVDRSSLIAFVERPEQDSVFRIRRHRNLPQHVFEDAVSTTGRQVCEHDDDDLVDRVVAVNGLSVKEQSLVTLDQLHDL